MAKIRFFFRVPAHQKFEYKPRYYNPEKEELEKILRRAESADSLDPEDIKQRMKGEFQRRRSKASRRGVTDFGYRKRQLRQSNLRLLAILVGILFVSIYFAMRYLPKLIQWLNY